MNGLEIHTHKPVQVVEVSRPSSFMTWATQHWIFFFAILMGLYVGLPFLAPVFMWLGWTTPGHIIYTIYSFQCHQLPERSFFLFGPHAMYPLADIQAAWKNTINPIILRQFIGNSEMGWKVAWSDRMVSMYTFTFLFGLLWWPLRHHIKPLPWWGFFLFLLPMAIDGTSHFVSDFAGIGQGFRYTNAWLAALTHNAFPPSFYLGDALGSFNSWMRLLSGFFFGIGAVWFGFPYIHEAFTGSRLP
jgi:uncharacterized membrane protein